MSAWLLVGPAVMLAAAVVALAARARPAAGAWAVVVASALATLALLAAGPGQTWQAPWLDVGGLRLDLTLRSTGWGWLMALTVSVVGFAINLFAAGYAAREQGRPRFHAWMSAFVAAMLALVLAGSFTMLFVAWELVGLASWALIGHRHEQPDAAPAATLAFVTTRLGDLALLLAWLVVAVSLGTSDLEATLDAAPHSVWTPWVAALVLVAAMAKSAQLPLSLWLPAAMVGPTPVSALLHSATMVAAGAFLLVRLSPLLAAAPGVAMATAVVGLAGALGAGLVATTAGDLKRVLAWSTVAQVGEMFLAAGVLAPRAAAHHLVSHAAFKSALFVAAGLFERRLGGHELAELRGAGRRLPFAMSAFGLAALALAGVPPLSGWFSERELLASAAAAGPGWAAGLVASLVLSAGYIGRAAGVLLAPVDARAPGPPSTPMTVATGVLAVAAALTGGLVAPAVRGLVPSMASEGPAARGWELAALVGALAALGLGTLSGMRRHEAPLLGAWARAPSRLLAGFESGVRAATRGLAAAAEAAEQALDALARGLATLVGHSADAASGSDARLGAAGDGLAGGLSRAGGLLARLEPGKIYLYTLGIFGWVLAATLLAVLLAR